MEKAEGDQKKELETVLKSAETHVQDLQKTVNKAQKHLDKQLNKLQ